MPRTTFWPRRGQGRGARRGARRLVGMALVTATMAAACSGGGGRQTGDRRAATGPPIVIGMINMEDTPVGSFPEIRRDAQAAVDYVNEELGGVGGRPLRLEVCVTNGSAESSQACANRLLEKRPVAVVSGVDLGAVAALSVVRAARVPYVGGAPTRLEEATAIGSYMLTGGPGAELLGEASYLVGKLRATKISIFYVDLPGLLSEAAETARKILQRKGVTSVKLVSEKADAADFTPALTSAAEPNPDAIVVVFPAQACSRIMQAKQALGVRARMFYLGACLDQGVLDSAGAAADQAYFASGFHPFTDTENDDVATYRREVRARASGAAKLSVLSQTGFSLMMNLHRLLDDVGGAAVTPAAVEEKLKAARGRASFMAHPYTCDGQLVPLLPSICAIHVRILQYRGGRVTDVAGDWVSGADLVPLAL